MGIRLPWFLAVLGFLAVAESAAQDPMGQSAPLVGPDKIRAEVRAWSFLAPLPDIKPATVLISGPPASGGGCEIRVVFQNLNFVHEIWVRNDSLVEIKMQHCPAKNCGDLSKRQKAILPSTFNLQVEFENDTDVVQVAVIGNQVELKETKSSRFIHFQAVMAWHGPTWALVSRGIPPREFHSLRNRFENYGSIEVVESGWYQGVPFEIEKTSVFMDRKNRFSFNHAAGQKNLLLVFIHPDDPIKLTELFEDFRPEIQSGKLVIQDLGGG